MGSSRGIELKKVLDRYLGIPLVALCHAIDEVIAIVRPRPTIDVRRILAVKLWGIGNLVMILPYLEALRRRFPDARICFLTTAANAGLLVDHPLIDRVFTLRTSGLRRPFQDLLRLAFQLRRERFDLLVDFEQFLRTSALLGFCAGARQRIGLRTPRQARASLYHARVPYRSDRHMTEVFGDVVRAAGAEVAGLPLLAVPRDPVARLEIESLLAQDLPGDGPLIALHPGSGDNFPGRRWPADRFAEVGDRLIDRHGARILVTGSETERALTHRVVCLMRHRALDTAGRAGLRAWIELTGMLDLIITNDTASVHVAGALGTPLVAIYGPNTPDLYGPLHSAARVAYHRLPCSPCLTNLNAKSSACRLPACVLGITADEILEAADDLLGATRPLTGSVP